MTSDADEFKAQCRIMLEYMADRADRGDKTLNTAFTQLELGRVAGAYLDQSYHHVSQMGNDGYVRQGRQRGLVFLTKKGYDHVRPKYRHLLSPTAAAWLAALAAAASTIFAAITYFASR